VTGKKRDFPKKGKRKTGLLPAGISLNNHEEEDERSSFLPLLAGSAGARRLEKVLRKVA